MLRPSKDSGPAQSLKKEDKYTSGWMLCRMPDRALKIQMSGHPNSRIDQCQLFKNSNSRHQLIGLLINRSTSNSPGSCSTLLSIGDVTNKNLLLLKSFDPRVNAYWTVSYYRQGIRCMDAGGFFAQSDITLESLLAVRPEY